MQLYSTNNKAHLVSLKEAVFQGLAEDKGLFMPTVIPQLPASLIHGLSGYSFQEIGFEITKALFGGAIPESAIRNIVEAAITFPAPVYMLDERLSVLELFHGPSLAFKDFGARFMAQLMSYFISKEEEKELTILVATSGDTGGAVAAGFYKTPGINVVILYPSGKVSDLQESQLTTMEHNITALKVEGTFDDCQALVKQAFLDNVLRTKLRLSSANSINIARLIPQSFYYFEAYKQVNDKSTPVVFSVPSGNFGNLTAGLMAYKMGLPVAHFIAATNLNDEVPLYLTSGKFVPRPSIATISNAMDVGNPSNFTRMLDLFSGIGGDDGSTWNNIRTLISGFSFNDMETRDAMRRVYDQYGYVIDPHGAIGVLAAWAYQQKEKNKHKTVVLETAHPSKFKEEVEHTLGIDVEIPERLATMAARSKQYIEMPNNYHDFREWLMNR